MLVSDDFTWGGTLLDYSEGGAQISAALELGVGSTVVFRVQRPGDAAPIEIEGVVRRTANEGRTSSDEVSLGIESSQPLSLERARK
jgi:hypothetical protein